MSAYVEQAARVTDPVKHSDLDFRLGLAVVAFLGGGVAILLAAPTAGGSVVLMTTLLSAADLAGSAADAAVFDAAIAERQVDREGDDEITDGAATVFLDEVRERAAKAHPETKLDHGDHWITHGSTTVFIENTYASRLGDRASCGGYISFGSETIFYGGEQINYPGTAPDPHEETASLYATYQDALMFASLVTLLSANRLLMLGRGRVMANPEAIRFSQVSAGGNGRGAALLADMRANGWRGSPVHAVRTRDGLATLDNTRVAAARRLGMTEVPVRVHNPGDVLPPSMWSRPWDRAGNRALTWGEALRIRTAGQGARSMGPTGRLKPPRVVWGD